jgi:GAF domain-containing protein
LIQEVCAAIGTQGPYILAWVGKAEDDEKKTVRVIGAYGSAIDYVKDIKVSWSEFEPNGLGPGGIAIRSGMPSLVIDSELDEGFSAWRIRAREFGIRSAIGCPIPDGLTSVDGVHHPYGVLLVYSKVPNAFGPSEVQLFQSLAQEIGFIME